MIPYTLVGGRYDDAGGKPSGYVKKLFEALMLLNPKGSIFNGGYFQTGLPKPWLDFDDDQTVIWMPDVPNDKQKIVQEIKKKNPYMILVTSKNNLEGKYSIQELIARALINKSNLFIEFTRAPNGYKARLMDPLGNQFCDTTDINELAVNLMKRLIELNTFSRASSKWTTGYSRPEPDEKFLGLVRKYADTFHELIHGTNTSRFLGNISFRCEGGFPSFKNGNCIMVSKRNIDKRDIGKEGFVPVSRGAGPHEIFYGGESKPSVDSPIQVQLYQYYPNIRFMMHSHTYIRDAQFTDRIIPCGCMEEFFEIVQLFPDRDIRRLYINLRGHGSLAMVDSVEGLENIDYIARQIPETQGYCRGF